MNSTSTVLLSVSLLIFTSCGTPSNLTGSFDRDKKEIEEFSAIYPPISQDESKLPESPELGGNPGNKSPINNPNNGEKPPPRNTPPIAQPQPPSDSNPPVNVVDFSQLLPLAWETPKLSRHSKEWSQITFRSILKHFSKLDQTTDAHRFCPKYYSLNRNQKINFWGQLIAAMAFFESGWKPVTRFREPGLGIDRITNAPVHSEGLLQLSYQDSQWYPWCKFDWSTDRHLTHLDPRKTIFDPKRNLECGIGILARQIERHKRIIINRGVYWSVIREGGRYQKIDKIREIVRTHKYCG